jgi:polyhydroxybutyrate depolymerase
MTTPSAGATAASAAAGQGGHAAQDLDAGPLPAADAAVEAPRSTGPGDWKAGDYPQDLMGSTYLELKGLPGQANTARQYKVHVPPSYDPKKPMPLVLCMHGLGQDPVMFCVIGADMPKKSDSAGFLLLMPFGYQNSWNAGTCCGGAVTEKIDDVGFIRALIKEVSSHLNIDLTRVYATGLSNGGYMSYRLACEASDVFVAVAPGAGAIGMDDIGGGTSASGDFSACKPVNRVSVLDLHGTEDPLIPYRLQKPSLERIAQLNGCMLQTQSAAQPASSGDTKCVSYTGCPAGTEVIGCSVDGGGHVWFGSPNCGTGVDAACAIVGANSKTLVNTDAVWSFFSTHARP